MKTAKILNLLQNTFCRLKASKIEGVGVFAIRNIPKGINPFLGAASHKWHKFNIKDLKKKLDKETLKMIDDFFVIEKDGEVYIPETGLNGIDVSFFVNNSKNPNLKILENGKDSALTFVTARKVKTGEELTVSYATYDDKYKTCCY
jgi:SET domain-containing protein